MDAHNNAGEQAWDREVAPSGSTAIFGAVTLRNCFSTVGYLSGNLLLRTILTLSRYKINGTYSLGNRLYVNIPFL